jgi:hypothetical protein
VLAQTLGVLGDQARGRAQDMRGGAIVLLEPDHLGAGKILFKAQDIGHFGAAPGIDRLVVVAHHADVLAHLRQQPQPQVLDRVGVLIFVHHDIAEAVLPAFQHVAVLAEDRQHVQQEIAEIAGVDRAQAVLIEPVDPGAAPVGIGFVLAGIEIGGPGPGSSSGRSARPAAWPASACRRSLRPGSTA